MVLTKTAVLFTVSQSPKKSILYLGYMTEFMVLAKVTILVFNFYYRNEFYFCGFDQCVNSWESLTN